VTYSKTRTVIDRPSAGTPEPIMRVIPVLDVRSGQAVRAVAGERDHYGPLRSLLHGGTDPVELARAARETWGLPDLYVADLDAILGESSPKTAMLQSLRDLGLTLWIDAGVREPADVLPLIDAGVERVIVGLETIQGPEALSEIVAEFGPERVVFSLDLHQGRPMIDTRPAWNTDRAEQIAEQAIDRGVVRLIHLDLARVGTGQGVATIDRLFHLSGRAVEWIVGGGISSVEEIRSLVPTGVAGVLVGSALHDGRIDAQSLACLRES
jgi:phosphoribosylformimino-5-aminoimidazole carboxamide ribotide isomerase